MHAQLKTAFETGVLLQPSWRRLNLVDLVRSLARLAGVRDMEQGEGTRRLMQEIGPADHLIFVLVDGMGMNLVDRLPQRSFIKSRLRMEIQSLFPTTTAAALTTVATGEWPNKHAVTGWWTHLPEFGCTSTILPFVDRYTHRSLTERGLSADTVFPCKAYHPRMTHQPLSVVPAKLPNTLYSVYSRGGTPGVGYWALDDGINEIIKHVQNASAPTYTYLYISDVDSLSHLRGWDHEDVLALMTFVDGQLGRLSETLSSRAKVVISSDHGHTTVRLADRLAIYDGDPILDALEAPPSGNPPTPMFHVKKGHSAQFVRLFEERFADHFSLVSSDEAEAMELCGPGKMTEIAKRRFGDFIGIARGSLTLKYYEHGKVPASDDFGGHSGLT
nr:alkaline phosphatase family protein [Gemmatimonadaceae bacterium]